MSSDFICRNEFKVFLSCFLSSKFVVSTTLLRTSNLSSLTPLNNFSSQELVVNLLRSRWLMVNRISLVVYFQKKYREPMPSCTW